MRVLGVDPGLTRCGLGVVDAHGRRARLVDVKVAATTADTPTPQRLQTIADALDAIIAEHAPHAIALERVFAQNNVRTVMGTAQASGVVMLAAARHGLDVALYTPSEVKAAVTGDGRAQKAQVGYMVARVLGLDAPPTPADAADALAIAITHAWRGVGSLPDAGQATARTAGSAQGDPAKNGDSARTSAQPSARERWAAAEAAARRRG